MSSQLKHDAELIDSFRQAIFEDKPGIWPDWVYEARNAVKHQTNESWLPDLLSALDWKSGTLHQAIGGVRRIVESEKEREKHGS